MNRESGAAVLLDERAEQYRERIQVFPASGFSPVALVGLAAEFLLFRSVQSACSKGFDDSLNVFGEIPDIDTHGETKAFHCFSFKP